MKISLFRARSSFPKWKIQKSTWGTKNKVKNTGKNCKSNNETEIYYKLA